MKTWTALVITLGILISSLAWSNEGTLASNMILSYRALAADYSTTPEVLNPVFISFERLQRFAHYSPEQLSQDNDFLKSMHMFSVNLDNFLNFLEIDTKKERLEALITVIAEKYGLENEIPTSLQKLYKTHVETIVKKITDENRFTQSSSDPNQPISFKGIKVKGNEVVKTIGTYGFWGFWFVTSTWALVKLSPHVENFMYYPAFAMFIASGPFSISNQIWTQVFDRIEKKAFLKHQTAIEYMKDRVRSLKYPWSKKRTDRNTQICLAFYK